MTLQQLHYVITISEVGSLNKAAEILYISQPSLSSSMQELEKELGITIFYRSGRGVSLTQDGSEFLLYARQVYNQYEVLMEKYGEAHSLKKKFGVSTQHYSFAVNAFVDLIKEYGQNEYDFSLRETQTYEIIEDVARMKSEIGVLYLDSFNEPVIRKLLKTSQLQFEPLFTARPHIFISSSHPLAKKKVISLQELSPYPYLSFEQGDHNSFYFSEELFSTEVREKNIRVRDRATLFNLLIGLNGYTICSGVIDSELNGSNIVAVPLRESCEMHIGYITHRNSSRSPLGAFYLEALKKYISH